MTHVHSSPLTEAYQHERYLQQNRDKFLTYAREMYAKMGRGAVDIWQGKARWFPQEATREITSGHGPLMAELISTYDPDSQFVCLWYDQGITVHHVGEGCTGQYVASAFHGGN